MDTWNTRLTKARESRGIDKAEFARRVGVSAPTVTDWESGKIRKLEAGNMLKVCMELGIAPLWLLYGRGAMDANASSVVPSPAPVQQPAGDGPAGAAASALTLSALLDALAERLARADPVMRAEISGLMLRYMEQPESGARIAQAIELLLATDGDPPA